MLGMYTPYAADTPVMAPPIIPAEYKGLRILLNIKRDPLSFFTTIMHKTGPYAWLSIRGKPLLMLNDATGIKHVLQTDTGNYFKGRFLQFLKPLFGGSVFLSEGKTWREQRESAAPVFANKNFPEMVQQMVSAVEAMFLRWDAKTERSEPIDLALEMTGFTLDVMLRALFHEAKDGVAYNMRSTLDTILTDAQERVWSGINIPTFIAHRLPKYHKARRFLRELVQALIDDRRANREYPEDLLSRLIEHYGLSPGNQVTMQDEVLAYLLSGHDTTAHGLSWAFYMLGLHPKHQQVMTGEIDRVLGNKIPTYEDLKSLTYTRQVFDEVLRLYPPVWSISREATKDDEILLDDGSKIRVHPGDGIMMCHYAVHRRAKYWENPEAFDPDRFSPEKIEHRPQYAWFPFGGGPRICIGFRFAQVESLLALAMITQRYELSLVPGQNIKPRPIITLRPDGAIFFDIKKRRQANSHNADSFISAQSNGARQRDEKRIHTPYESKPEPHESSEPAKCPFHRAS